MSTAKSCMWWPIHSTCQECWLCIASCFWQILKVSRKGQSWEDVRCWRRLSSKFKMLNTLYRREGGELTAECPQQALGSLTIGQLLTQVIEVGSPWPGFPGTLPRYFSMNLLMLDSWGRWMIQIDGIYSNWWLWKDTGHSSQRRALENSLLGVQDHYSRDARSWLQGKIQGLHPY